MRSEEELMKIDISRIRAFIKDESKQKIIIGPLLVVLFFVGWAAIDQLGVFNTSKPPAAATGSKQSKAQPQKAQVAQTKNMPANPSLPDGSSDVSKTKFDIAQSNPFIADKNTVAQNTMNAGTVNALPMNANGSLPAIPGYQPRPNVGTVPIPSMPPIPGSPSGYQSQAAPTSGIQGVFTGNDGKNIAIMSDGKIVQEGDEYGGNRIAAITGNGIHFDDGNNISYGIK